MNDNHFIKSINSKSAAYLKNKYFDYIIPTGGMWYFNFDYRDLVELLHDCNDKEELMATISFIKVKTFEHIINHLNHIDNGELII